MIQKEKVIGFKKDAIVDIAKTRTIQIKHHDHVGKNKKIKIASSQLEV